MAATFRFLRAWAHVDSLLLARWLTAHASARWRVSMTRVPFLINVPRGASGEVHRGVFTEDAGICQSYGLGTIADIELGEEASQLGLDRVLADVEMGAELQVRHACREERK